MVWQWHPYTLLLAATAAALLGFGAFLLVRGADPLSEVSLVGLVLLVGGLWVGVYTLRFSAATLPAKVLLARIEAVPLLALPVVWFAYVLRYVGRTDWLSWRVFGPLLTVAGGMVATLLTDMTRRLVYREYGLAQVGSVTVFDPVYGPAIGVFLGFVYTLLGASLLFLATAAAHAKGVFRWQIALLFLFAGVPGMAGLVFVSGANPVPGLNVAALSLAVVAVGGAVGYARFDWPAVTPIARDQTFESMTEAVVVLDAERRIIDVNGAAAALLGGVNEGAVGAVVADVIPEVAGTIDELVADIDADGEGTARTKLTRTVGDERRIIDIRASPTGAETGGTAGYTLVFRDVTARTEAERRAAEHRRKMAELHDVASDLAAARTREAVFQRAVDGGSRVLDADVCRLAAADDGRLAPAASSGAESVDPYDPQSADAGIAGRTYQSEEIVVVDDLDDARTAAAAGEPEPYLPDGGDAAPRSGDTYRSLLSAPVGDVGIVQALADEPGAFTESDREAIELLTTHIETAVERAAAESELRTERDRLEEFASVVSHDLRNPLNVAQGRIKLLREEVDEGEHVEPIDNSLSRMEAIITDLLTLTREGEAVGDVVAIDLGDCVTEAWTTVDTGSATLAYDGDLGTIEADGGRLRQLLENLFRNAVEHGSTGSRSQAHGNSVERGSTSSRTQSDDSVEHGLTSNRTRAGDSVADGSTTGADDSESSVTVRVGHLDDEPGFYVADDGPGIPAGEQEAIFEHGYTTEPGGTGLGLTIVARIAEAHGWTIAATEADGGGARFEIRTDP